MAELLDFTIQLSLLTRGNLNAAVSPAAQKLAELSAQMQKLNQVSNNINGFQKQSQKLTELRAKLDLARTKVRDMQTVMRSGGSVDARLFTKANEEAARLQEKVAANTKKLGEFRAALQGAGVDTSKLSSAQQKLQAQTDAMARAQARLSSAQARYNELLSRLSWSHIRADIFTTIASAKMMLAPVRLAADFEAAMARVKAVAFTKKGTDITQFDILKEQAEHLGAVTKFTAIEAAYAQENLARAGMSVSNIVSAMPAVLNMAAAEGLDLETSSRIIAKSLGGMSLEGKYASRLADILAYTSASTNTNIAMLGEAFKEAAPVAASQGIAMEQLAAYLGVMANRGFEGSQAGSAFGSSLQRLAKRPKMANDALNLLGVATRTRNGKMRELPDIMIALNESMKKLNMGENQQLGMMAKIFGAHYGTEMLAFMQASVAGEVERLQSGVYNDSFGQSKAMTDINLDTMTGKLSILKSAWAGVARYIGDILTPPIKAFIDLLTIGLTKFLELMKAFPTISKYVTLGLGTLGLAKISYSIWNIGSGIFKLGGAWLEVHRATLEAEAATKLVTSAIGGSTAAANGFGMSLSAALGYIGLIVGASVLIYQNWEKITAWAERAGEAIKSIDRAGPVNTSSTEYHIRNMESAFSIPEITPHASGGIMTRPHVGLVAEAGAEAIIPLTDRSRGVPLIMQAAQMLGVPSGLMPPGQDSGQPNRVGGPSWMRSIGSAIGRTKYGGLAMSVLDTIARPSEAPSIKEANSYVNNMRASEGDNVRADNVSSVVSPVVNLTVNVMSQEGQSSQSLAVSIADEVRKALAEFSSLNERVSFA